MQTSAIPEVMDIARAAMHVIADCSGGDAGAFELANNCLLAARRLVEQGCATCSLFDWGWDFHGTSRRSGLASAA